MVSIEGNGFEFMIFKPERPIARLLLAHGAGAGNKHEFMQKMAAELASHNIEVISFNFPYMQLMYEQESKRPPNSNKQLVAYYSERVKQACEIDDLPLFIAGKSMGGRIATQIMVDSAIYDNVNGVAVFGYPFIPPGKPEKYGDRVSHFSDIRKPVLVCQGERDTFGNKAFLTNQTLPSHFELSWIPSGDHSFKPLKSSGLSSEDNIKLAARLTAEFIQKSV